MTRRQELRGCGPVAGAPVASRSVAYAGSLRSHVPVRRARRAAAPTRARAANATSATIIMFVALGALPLAGCATRPAGSAGAPGTSRGPAAAAPAPSPTPIAERLTGDFTPSSTHMENLAPGVAHTELRIPTGPWLVHVVEVAPNACGVELHTVKGLGHVVGRERPSEMARRTATAEGRPVLAAVNADFFNFTPPGVSEGPQVSGGRVVKSEDRHRAALPDTVLREQPVFGVAADGKPFFGDAHLDGWLRVADAEQAPLLRVNRGADSDSLTLYNSFFGEWTPIDTGAVEVVVRTVRAAAMAGDTAVGVVVRVDTLPNGVEIPEDGVVLAGGSSKGGVEAGGAHAESQHAGSERPGSPSSGGARSQSTLRASLQPGDSVRWSLPFRGAPARVKELTGGFPMLLRNGESVLERFGDMIPGFSVKEHPRTAVALRPDGKVLLVAVDGRSESSGGMSLPQLTEFLRALGATDALNLDGGGSTVLALDGQVVSHPSDKEGERAVSNALLVLSGGDRCGDRAPR